MKQQILMTDGNMVPNGIDQIGVIYKYSFMDYFRSRRFFILMLITIIIGLILTIAVAYYRPSTFLLSNLSFYSSWWGMTSTFIIILSAVFFGGDAISGEFQNKTGYFLAVNPIRRSSIYVGKLTAAFSASLIILLLFVLITIGNGLYYFQSMPTSFYESIGLSILYLVSVLGLTFFFSSLFKSNSMAILVTVILFFFVFSLVQSLVSDLAHVEPWFILTYGSGVISNVLQSTYPPQVVTMKGGVFGGGPGGFSGSSYNATLSEGILIMSVYFIVSAICGLVLFELKEFN